MAFLRVLPCLGTSEQTGLSSLGRRGFQARRPELAAPCGIRSSLRRPFRFFSAPERVHSKQDAPPHCRVDSCPPKLGTPGGDGAKPMVPCWDKCTHFGLFSGDWLMLTGGTIWVLTHGQMVPCAHSASHQPLTIFVVGLASGSKNSIEDSIHLQASQLPSGALFSFFLGRVAGKKSTNQKRDALVFPMAGQLRSHNW